MWRNLYLVVVVGAVRCSASSYPLQAWEGVRAELELSQVEEWRGCVSLARTGNKTRTGPGTGPEDREHGGFEFWFS